MSKRPPKLWYLTSYSPRSWKLALLEALSWGEFRVERPWIVPDPDSASGYRVYYIPLSEVAQRDADARAYMDSLGRWVDMMAGS